MIDLIWNGWHFASQHAGVLRIYSRKVGGGSAWLERHGLRLFIFYTALRVAAWTTGWLGSDSSRAKRFIQSTWLCSRCRAPFLRFNCAA